MARIIVTDDTGSHVALDERDVKPMHLDDESSAVQLLERLAWGIKDAELRRHRRRRKRKAQREAAIDAALGRPSAVTPYTDTTE